MQPLNSGFLLSLPVQIGRGCGQPISPTEAMVLFIVLSSVFVAGCLIALLVLARHRSVSYARPLYRAGGVALLLCILLWITIAAADLRGPVELRGALCILQYQLFAVGFCSLLTARQLQKGGGRGKGRPIVLLKYSAETPEKSN
jgi:hypothetical protein